MTSIPSISALRVALAACPEPQSDGQAIGATVYELTDYRYRGTTHQVNRWAANVQTAQQPHELDAEQAAKLAAYFAAANPAAIAELLAALDAQAVEVASLRADAERYRWLRDKSVPPHNFYLSVPIEFDGVRYTPDEVDAGIDAARASLTGAKHGSD